MSGSSPSAYRKTQTQYAFARPASRGISALTTRASKWKLTRVIRELVETSKFSYLIFAFLKLGKLTFAIGGWLTA